MMLCELLYTGSTALEAFKGKVRPISDRADFQDALKRALFRGLCGAGRAALHGKHHAAAQLQCACNLSERLDSWSSTGLWTRLE